MELSRVERHKWSVWTCQSCRRTRTKPRDGYDGRLVMRAGPPMAGITKQEKA